MNTKFQYSILQYHHSAALNEALNVGILFCFLDTNVLHFVAGNSNRLKSIYPDIKPTDVNQFIKVIENKVQKQTKTVFDSSPEKFLNHIHQSILSEDSSSLQFNIPLRAVSEHDNIDKIIEHYSKLFLPNTEEKTDRKKHDEPYIISQFNSLVSNYGGERLTNYFARDFVKRNFVEVKFDIIWENGTLNYVKPLSFDLIDPYSIQRKAAEHCTYLNQLKDYTPRKGKKVRYDFLIAKPQDRALNKSYNNAIKLLNNTNANKQVLTEEKWEEYSHQTVIDFKKHLDKELEDNPSVDNDLF